MKISDWCILFIPLFCGMILCGGFQSRYDRQAQGTMELYNRILDRAAEDALTDRLQEEYEDGSLKINEKKVQEHFLEQIAFVFDMTSETEKERLEELFLFRKLVNEKGELSREDSRKIQNCMEQAMREKTVLSYMSYYLLFPFAEGEEWAHNLKNHAFYSFMELPDKKNYPWTVLFDTERIRYAFSGAELVKKEDD